MTVDDRIEHDIGIVTLWQYGKCTADDRTKTTWQYIVYSNVENVIWICNDRAQKIVQFAILQMLAALNVIYVSSR